MFVATEGRAPMPFDTMMFDPDTLGVLFQHVRVDMLHGVGGFIVISKGEDLSPRCGLVQTEQLGPLRLVRWATINPETKSVHVELVNQPLQVVVRTPGGFTTVS